LHTFADYTSVSSLKALSDVSSANESVNALLDAFQVLILKQRELLDISSEAGDEGTNALMSDYIREQEKQVWMYSAYLNA
jgi:starvation-inducible DNA-binding protein